MSNAPDGIVVPSSDLSRQAVASIGGYAYQLLVSVDAWLSLEADGVLILEVAEDYAVLAGKALTATQVKRTSSSVSLRTPSVVETINAFWRLQSANSDLAVQSIYLTTSRIAKEKNAGFPEGIPGLRLWSDAIYDRTRLRILRDFLRTLPLSDELADWLTSASDDELCINLLSRVQWQCGAPSFRELETRTRERMRKRCEIFGILPSESDRATDAALIELLKIAAYSGRRELRRSDLVQIIESSTAYIVPAATMRRFFSRQGGPLTDSFRPPLTLRENEGGERFFFFAAENRIPLAGRESELATLEQWLNESEKFSWTLLTGPAGSGKSRLALELCLKAKTIGWHAGFFYSASEIAKPEQFRQFQAFEPTLLVWDYVMEAPVVARAVIDIIIEQHSINAFKHPVRILLIERSNSSGGWWQRFFSGHADHIRKFTRKLGESDRYLELKPLGTEALRRIVGHVLSGSEGDEEVLDDLKQIDPLGRPFFAALAADALKNGRAAPGMSIQALLNDILDREQFRWRVLARDDLDIQRHENALALATMMGGLPVPQATSGLPLEVFPFSQEAFNFALMEEMTQGKPLAKEIHPLEPDLVGEWFVLKRLVRAHPFDQRPDQLVLAAESLAILSPTAAAAFGVFRTRLAEDFPEAFVHTQLLRAPIEGAPVHTFVEWDTSLANSLEHLRGQPRTAYYCLQSIKNLVPTLFASSDFQVAASAAYFNYAALLLARNRYAEAEGILHDVFEWASQRTDLPELAAVASRLGEILGEHFLAQGDIDEATRIFHSILTFAQEINLGKNEKDDVIDNAASLGLSIRESLASRDDQRRLRDLNGRLWAKPTAKRTIDMASNTGSELMFRSTESSAQEIFNELKTKSLARPDVKAIGFWAANVAYSIVRDAKDPRAFVDGIRELAYWVSHRVDWPDMLDVVYDAIDHEWITEDFKLGRAPIEALFQLWSEGVLSAAKGHEIGRNNEIHFIRKEIEDSLLEHGRLPWAQDMRRRIALIEQSFANNL